MKCVNCPTESDPIEYIDDQDETHFIIGCPCHEIDANTHEALMLTDCFEHGAMPVQGGVLDQANSIIEAIQMIRNERIKWSNKKHG